MPNIPTHSWIWRWVAPLEGIAQVNEDVAVDHGKVICRPCGANGRARVLTAHYTNLVNHLLKVHDSA